MSNPRVGIVMGSDSDLKIMQSIYGLKRFCIYFCHFLLLCLLFVLIYKVATL